MGSFKSQPHHLSHCLFSQRIRRMNQPNVKKKMIFKLIFLKIFLKIIVGGQMENRASLYSEFEQWKTESFKQTSQKQHQTLSKVSQVGTPWKFKRKNFCIFIKLMNGIASSSGCMPISHNHL